MKLLEKPSEIIFRLAAMPYLQGFEEKSPEMILKRSLGILDSLATDNLKVFVRDSQTESGGFKDRAGDPDLYYTLFGCFLADAFGMKDITPLAWDFVHNSIRQTEPEGVNLHCAAIIAAKSGHGTLFRKLYGKRIREGIKKNKQPVYSAFLAMLSCWYLSDFRALFMIKKQMESLAEKDSLPCPANAALLVLQKSFGKPVGTLRTGLLSYYHSNGGFKALSNASLPDLLSTAVALYALDFTGSDLRMIKPNALEFVDSLFRDGGFAANLLDQVPDIEYTFYGLLALGSLAG